MALVPCVLAVIAMVFALIVAFAGLPRLSNDAASGKRNKSHQEAGLNNALGIRHECSPAL
jgi:hypothetical protein